MRFAVIAAGEGSRLAAEGIKEPKPLVRVGGEALLTRLLRIFRQNGATEVVVVCNDRTAPAVSSVISGEVRLVVKSTPSSMHSLWAISPYLAGEPFVLTTVDTVFNEQEFSRYVADFRCADADALMGITHYVDDEKPLWVGVEEEEREERREERELLITGFYDIRTSKFQTPDSEFVSAGIYGLKPQALKVLERCIERGESRMRNFQRALISEGLRVKAWQFGKVIDIDHASDILEAEKLTK
jgi:NDP-sugar pyrophosphorylase family protein